MRKCYGGLCVLIVLLAQMTFPIFAVAEVKEISSETLDSWMPDKNLQKAIAEKYEVEVDGLTKELLENSTIGYQSIILTDDINVANNEGIYYVESLEGLQYATGLRVYLDLYHTTNTGMSVDLSYFLTSKNDPTKYQSIYVSNYNPDFTNYGLFWDYLNDEDPVSGFSLVDGDALNRFSNVNLETTSDEYENISIPISEFYKKGTPFATSYFGAIASIDVSETVLDENFDRTKEQNNPIGFLDYVYVTQGDIKLVYAVYLESDNLVFKFRETEQEVSAINAEKPLNVHFIFNHRSMLLPASTQFNLAGVYQFSTQFNLDIILKKTIAKAGNVTARYEDEVGENILDNVVLTGEVGQGYATEQKAIPGYTFKELKTGSAEAVGIFTDTAQVVTYVYTKDSFKEGNVTVYYEDEAGERISDDVVLIGEVGQGYTTEQKAIPGYTFKELKTGSAEAVGIFTDTAQAVTYVYTKNSVEIGDSDTENKTSKNSNKRESSSNSNKKLPSTGEITSSSIGLIGFCMLVLGGVIYLIDRKRKD